VERETGEPLRLEIRTLDGRAIDPDQSVVLKVSE